MTEMRRRPAHSDGAGAGASGGLDRAGGGGGGSVGREAAAETAILFANREVARAERRIAQVLEATDRALLRKEELLREAAQEAEARDAHIAHLEKMLAGVYASTSWKVARPVRVASRVVQRLRPRTQAEAAAAAAPDAASAGDAAAASEPARAPAAPALGPDAAAVLRRLRGDPPVT